MRGSERKIFTKNVSTPRVLNTTVEMYEIVEI